MYACVCVCVCVCVIITDADAHTQTLYICIHRESDCCVRDCERVREGRMEY